MVTMDDVARHAGVSGSTVSHVLNGTRKVEPSTRTRVEVAVVELGYRQNVVARALAGGRSNTIGLAMSGLTNQYFGSLMRAIEQRVADAGYMLLIGETHDDVTLERRVIDSLLARRVDGLIIAPAVGSEIDNLPTVARSGTPMVLIDRSAPGDFTQVVPENTKSAAGLTRHLLELGHRRIAVVTGLRGLPSSFERYLGYVEALADFNVDVDARLVLQGDSNADVAERVVRELFADPVARPTALVVLNNAMTIGTLKALRALSLSIPSDVALTAFDDFEWADLFQPRLTTIAQDLEMMGYRAVESLMGRIAGEDTPSELVRIPTQFMHRNSCGCDDQVPASRT